VFPRVLSSTSGDPWLETEGEFWRAISHVPNTTSPDKLETPAQALAVGYGLGRFHELLHDLPCDQLADTLEGFHITPLYLQQYRAVPRSTTISGRDAEREEWAHRFIAERAAWAGVLEEAKAAGELPLRPIHGDPKVTNVLLDAVSGQAVALVDLDTVKPGLVHYDIGDALRSGCNPLGEETTAFEAVRFDLGLCEALLEGYGAAAHRFLSPADHHYLFDAIRLLSFELGVRFFTDHLAGNVYFHTQRPGHNLDRALVQFHLTASIEAQEREIRGLLARLREAR
jgi:Ser/Thr protein kinase RdoA (MazF antagonist)